MASPFGATGGGGLFGSPFGAAASPATPAFGAASTPGFGAPTSTPGFGFGQPAAATQPTSLFGATPATPAPFGATPSPGGGLFGANATPNVFGANASPNLFGANTTPNLFGAPATAANTAPSLFGATSPSLFGGASTPAPASSPFGGGLFGGGSQMAPATFGNPALSPAQGAVPQTGAAVGAGGPGAASAVKEISEIRAAYTPGAPGFKFQYLLLNVVDNPAQRVKPGEVDEMRWRAALAAAGGPDNPDRLWPVAAVGFKDLIARSAAQAAALDENAARLKALQDLTFRLAKRQGSELKQRAADVQARHLELAARLLGLCRTLDGLESRLAASVGFRADVARAREDKLSRLLATVESELAPKSLTGLARRLDAVAAASQQRAGLGPGSGTTQARLDERSNASLLGVLRDHADGIAKLQTLLKRDALDMAIMRQELEGEDGGGPGRQQRGVMLLD